MLLFRLVIFLFLWRSLPLHAGSLPIDENFSSQKIGLHLDLALSNDEELPLNLSNTLASLNWNASTQEVPNFGYHQGALWARIEIEDRRAQPEPLYLELTYAQADFVDLYEIQGSEVKHSRSGDHRLRKDWALDSRYPSFLLKASARHTIYLRLAGQSSYQLPLNLSTASSYVLEREKEEIIQALYYGAILVMVLYNSLVWMGTRLGIYGIYVLYLLGYLIFQLALNGHGYRYVWPDAVNFADCSTIIGILIFGNAATYFSRELLAFRHIPRLMLTVQRWLLFGSLPLICLNFLMSYRFAINVTYVLFVIPWLGLMIYISIQALKRRDRIARWYVVSWSFFLTGCFLALSQRLQILPSNVWTTYGIQVGSVLEFLLFSFALAERIKILQEKVQREQARVLEVEKIAHAAAEHALEQERSLSKQREYLLANTSHELRTPLNGILGYLELVLHEQPGAITHKTRSQIQKALHLTESLKYQVNTILDISKAKKGSLTLKTQYIILDDIKNEADTLAEGLGINSQNVEYISFLDAEHETFIGDREKVLTIIRNLLGNAFKFRALDRRNSVSLELVSNSSHLKIIVRDQGIGIDARLIDSIFEEFSQVQQDARRSFEGTGLGLSLVKQLLTLMKGTIEVRSEVGKGTCFTAVIPSGNEKDVLTLQEPNFEEQTQLAQLVAIPEQDNCIGKESIEGDSNTYFIYIIDDNLTNCEVIAGLLKLQGYTVMHSLAGMQGLRDMRANPPHLLILDMMMPDFSGEDVIAHMQKDPLLQEIPVMVITAGASEKDRIHALSLGADDYLPKPVHSLELRLRVKNLIQRHELLRQIERGQQELKMVQMGEMFGDLSHELKNILFGSGLQADLEVDDATLAASVLSFSDEGRQNLIQGLLSSVFEGHLQARLENLPLPKSDSLHKHRRLVRILISEMNIPPEVQRTIWDEALLFPSEELHFLCIQLKLFRQNKQLLHTISRCRDFTQSILTFSRDDRQQDFASIKHSWLQTTTMVNSRLRKNGIQLRTQLSEHMISFPASQLLQILLNLSINALDAVEDLLPEEKWISIESQVYGDKISLFFANGGRPIPKDLQEKIFERGFSTKGVRGNGLGLYLARRLIHKSGGELLYRADASNPCFQMVFNLARDHALQTSA